RDRTMATARVAPVGSPSLVSIGLFSVLLGVPLAVVWEASGPYDDPKTWALPILVMLTGVAWLARQPEDLGRGAFRDVRARLVRWTALGCVAWTVITTVTSVAPIQSVLGTLGRGMGLLTIGSAIFLFFLVQAHWRSAQGVRSLIDVALVGSIPVC